METHVGEHYRDGHFHDASEHGLAWASLNELLHVIVFVYTLYGMIQFGVKFIHMIGLVKWISKIIIAHNFYLSLKFALIAALMYKYNSELEQAGVELAQFNCSLTTFPVLMRQASRPRAEQTAEFFSSLKAAILGDFYHNSQPLTSLVARDAELNGNSFMVRPITTADSRETSLDTGTNTTYYYYRLTLLPQLNTLMQLFGGPFALLGNRATMMYGLYAISIFIMMAIFPLELMCFIDVGFNFIRFVLSDPGCMKDLYAKRREHLSRLSTWSRSCTVSLHTELAKVALRGRDLQLSEQPNLLAVANQLASIQRQSYSSHLNPKTRIQNAVLKLTRRPKSHVQDGAKYESSAWLVDSNALSLAFCGQLTLEMQRQQRQRLTATRCKRVLGRQYAISVAKHNLERFKPFVRSDVWFKAAMIIYPSFIFFYFISLSLVIGYIDFCSESARNDLEATCERRNRTPDWSLGDTLLYYEGKYTVFLISCASSFYCSYYFGTILELHFWMSEIEQQVRLCSHVIALDNQLSTQQIDDDKQQPLGTSKSSQQRLISRRDVAAISRLFKVDKYVNDYGGFSQIFPGALRHINYRLELTKSLMIDLLKLRFKRALHWLWLHLVGQPERDFINQAELHQLAACMLLTKKETIMRATYVNMCLFFDELEDTRFMTTTILRRTTQMAAGLAFMASITRSQFKENYLQLFYFQMITFAVFNLYLACAAHINSQVNKMVFRVHSLICTALKSETEGTEMFEHWLRQVQLFNDDTDAYAYNIYGFKVTWKTIMNIDSAIFTVYFMTVDHETLKVY